MGREQEGSGKSFRYLDIFNFPYPIGKNVNWERHNYRVAIDSWQLFLVYDRK
jgi:hypothetical protein